MLKYLIEKEFKQLFRNKALPKFIFVFPFMVLLVLPLAADFEVKNINLCVIDNNKSPYSVRLINKVISSGYFRLTAYSGSNIQALKSIEKGETDIILEIPNDFEVNLVKNKNADVLISADAVNGTKGGLGSAYLSYIINNFSEDVRHEMMPTSTKAAIPTFNILSQYRYNPHLRYPIFMVPALMVMVMSLLSGFLPAFNIVGEKEKGTIEQINVTPVSKFKFILSKLIPFWTIGFVVLTICFGVALIFYNLIPAGSLFTIYLFASVFVLAFSGFGLVISNYANSIQQAAFMMFFFVITFIFLSGLYTPVSSMPEWAQIFSHFSPLKYFINVMRQVYLKGSNIQQLIQPLLALLAFAVFFNTWAILSYSKKRG
jgi:ABC-2 type transport system permease protein